MFAMNAEIIFIEVTILGSVDAYKMESPLVCTVSGE